jgi:hypothetical protein
MTSDTPQRLIDGQRGQRYGEVLAAYLTDEGIQAHVYGTQVLNDCPQELWAQLDADAIAKEMEAVLVKLNGPRYWMLDGLGPKAQPIEPVMREFGGIMMRRIAVVNLGSEPAQIPYTIRHVDRRVAFFFDAGSRVFELVDAEGFVYVMQARCVGVDPEMSEEALLTLGDRLALPEGWTYRTHILDKELVVDTSDHPASVVQDEFENTYSLLD